jgi:nucleoside-diphosphate-sugar epimerase
VRAWHHTYGLPVLTTNCSNNYGPYQFPEKLIPLMIVNALAGKPLPIYGDGQNVRDWLYVGDHCSAIREVLARGRRARPTTSAAGTRWPTSRSCTPVRAARRAAPPTQPAATPTDHLCEGPPRPRPPLRDRRAQDRARARLAPGGDLRQTGIRKTVQWYLDNPAWIANVQSGAYRDWVARNYAGREAQRMKILLLGKNGQVGWELQRALAPLGTCRARPWRRRRPVWRPRGPRGARPHRAPLVPDVIVNAAAYTAVDKAETDVERAQRINAEAPGVLARAAARWARCWCITRPTTCSTAAATPPGARMRDRTAVGVRPQQARRRGGDPQQRLPPPDPAHLLGVCGARRQLRPHHAAPGGRARAPDRHRRPARRPHRRGADRRRQRPCLRAERADRSLGGTYHLAAGGETSWHGYASFVIEQARARGDVLAGEIAPIATRDYPTAAARPLNSRLDTSRLRERFGLVCPTGATASPACCARFLD